MNTNNTAINSPETSDHDEAVVRSRRLRRVVAAGLTVAFTFGAVACSSDSTDSDPLTDDGGITDDGVVETPVEETPLEEAPLEEAPADDGVVEDEGSMEE